MYVALATDRAALVLAEVGIGDTQVLERESDVAPVAIEDAARERRRQSLRVLFEELLVRLPDLELAEPDVPLPRRRGNFVLGIESMPVRFSPTGVSA